MCSSDLRTSVVVRLCLLLVLASALLVFGCMPYELRSILDGPQGKALTVSPSATAVLANSTISFSASGGVAPYSYAVVSGTGSINPASGLYTAPVSAGTAVIRVTDKTGKSVDAAITIQAAGTGLAISPSSIMISVGASITFVAIGGTGSYTFSIQASPGSINPAINAATGFYTGGNTPGLDVVVLNDGANTVTANVTVVPTSTVDYTITGTALSATGTVSKALAGGQTFALKNNGTSNGTQPVSWNVYLSANTLLDAGDALVASGTTGFLNAGASNNAVAVTGGAFPAVAPGPYYLIIQVSSNDDTTPGNNTSAAVPVTLNPKNIDYRADPVSAAPPLIAGGPMNGTFTITNLGTDAGGDAVLWQVRASLDTTLDAGDYIVAGGTIAAQPASTTSPTIDISGSWPSTPGPWYLIAIAVSADDVNHLNDTSAPTLVTTTGTPPADVEYTVQTVTNMGGTTAGQPISAEFTYRNNNTGAGSQTVYWTAYVSADATLQIGTDPVIDSGVVAALPAATTSPSPTSFGGTWPSTPGTWHLIVAISASDDVNPGNNTLSTAVSVTVLNVDYRVETVSNGGGTVAGDPLSGTFTYKNWGTQNGGQNVVWTASMSPDATLDGTDAVIGSGVVSALNAGVTSPLPISFSAAWPASPGVWHIFISLTATEDVTPGNNSRESGGISTSAPNVNYAVSGVTNTGPTVAGGMLQGSVTITNVGSHAGTQFVPWRVYVSTSPTLGAGTDYLVYSSSIASPGLGSGGSTSPSFTATWPTSSTNQNYYLIVETAAADDVAAGNNAAATGTTVAVTGIAPNYSITGVVPPSAPFYTGQSASGTLTVQNGGTAAGSSTVFWQVYASLGNSTYDIGDTLIASNSFGPLGVSGSQTPAYAGSWPATPGTYFIIVRVSTADDPTIADFPSGPIVVTTPPPPDYTASFSPGIPWTGLVATAINPAVNPWLTVQNLNANPGHATVNWSVYLSTDNVLDAGDTLVQASNFGPLGGSGSASVAFVGPWPAAPGLYYLIASIQAVDDGNVTNNVVAAPRPIPVGNYRYVEGAEDNSGKGPNPNVTKTSDTTVTNLAANQVLVIEGTMDAYQGANSQYDTYKFTAGAGVNNLSFRAVWVTGFDDVDLYLWDTGATNLSSIDTSPNSEPIAGTFDVTSVAGPRVCFISGNFYLANNTSGSAGQPYAIFVKALP